jgi:integral membrane protein
MTDLFKTPLGRLRLLAFVEGISFLGLLFITMPLKYIFQVPEPNKIFGMIHGLLFMMYVLAVAQQKIEQNWKVQKMLLALLAAVLPFGTFWADKKLFRPETP